MHEKIPSYCIGKGNSGYPRYDMTITTFWTRLDHCICDDDPYSDACAFCQCERGNTAGCFTTEELTKLLLSEADRKMRREITDEERPRHRGKKPWTWYVDRRELRDMWYERLWRYRDGYIIKYSGILDKSRVLYVHGTRCADNVEALKKFYEEEETK